MKIKNYKCKCGYNDFFFADKGNQKGIYCTYCGRWLKWADKDEQNLTLNQEPKSEWQHDHAILKAYSDGANEVLGKIRAEVEKLQKMCDKNDLNLMAQYSAFGMVLDMSDIVRR